EVRSVKMIEALRDVARHFEVLHLIASDWHPIGFEQQDVCRHQHGIHEEAGSDAGVLVLPRFAITILSGFVRVCAVEQTLAGYAGKDPGELRYLRNIALSVEPYALGIQPACKPCRGDLQSRALHARRILNFDEGMVVREEIEALGFMIAACGDRDRKSTRLDSSHVKISYAGSCLNKKSA